MGHTEVPISLAELPTLELENFQWNLALPPYASTQAIGVNLDRVNRMAKHAAFDWVTISGYEEANATHASVVGFMGHVPILQHEKNKPLDNLYKVDLSSDHPELSGSVVNIRLNLGKIAYQLMRHSTVKNMYGWSQLLDAGIRHGLSDALRKPTPDNHKRSIKDKLIAKSLVKTGKVVETVA